MLAETFFQDLRIGGRVLAKEKSFCALAVFVLAIGIAAVTTQYAIVNGTLLHAFSFREADRLVDVLLVSPKNFTPDNFYANLSTADFADLRERQKSFEAFTGYLNGSTVNLTYNGQPKRFQGGYVTWDFFRNLGVAPVLGRDFLAEEDRPNVDKAVILTDALWRSDFGADPGVIGKAVRVNGRAGTIVGVMPPKFAFPSNEQLWIPVNAEFPVKPRDDPGINFISIIARLKPGVSIEQATAEISAYAQEFAKSYPKTNAPFTLGYVRPLIRSFTGGGFSQLLLMMMASCVGVLLIACVNVMNMQFARATLRGKELAIRSSLGATRVRLIRQMLTESLLVASLGALLGIGLAVWATDYLDAVVHTGENPIPAWMVFSIDPGVLAMVVGATLLSALVSGFVPAWLSSRASAIDALKDSGRGNTGRSVNAITRGLVVFQIVLTSALLISAVLEVKSIVKQETLDYGYDTGAVLGARVGLMEGDYPDSDRRRRFYEQLLRQLRATPQFEAVALTDKLRMVFSNNGPVEIEGKVYKTDDDRTFAETERITRGYFDTLGVRLREGRDFTDDDSDQKLPVAIVNAKFAHKHFGNESPLGRRIRFTQQNGSTPGPWRVIVGVVADVRMQGPFNAHSDGSGYYVPFFANPFGQDLSKPVAPQFGTILVRPPGGQRPEALVAAVQSVVTKVDPNLPLYFVGTPRSSIDGQLAQNRTIALMFTVFGSVAVLLASVGLYGVTSFSVNQRTQEFGVRMALGADTGRILRMVLRQGAWQIGLGLVLGVGVMLGLSYVLEDVIANILFQTNPRDPLTYAAVATLLAAIAFIATLVPARRATRVDPMIALRAE